ncbi:uncharacterized protein LOC123684102 [Harmonia axyridis]|uniref:uncharacterized protein LOC123684102 n=1 Tax=Harmonia axyridis TaxID=115357 RepID=UPI001E2766EA|nr:uncharacterized protein LOC123684102 [Harmonia axyridis]
MERKKYSLDKSTQVYPKDLVSDRREVCCANTTCSMHIPLNSIMPSDVHISDIQINASLLLPLEKTISEKREVFDHEFSVNPNEDDGVETREFVHMKEDVFESRLSMSEDGIQCHTVGIDVLSNTKSLNNVKIEMDENNERNIDSDKDIDQLKIYPPLKIEPCDQVVENTDAEFDMKKNFKATSEENIFAISSHHTDESLFKNHVVEKNQMKGITNIILSKIEEETMTIITQDEVEFGESVFLVENESLNPGNSSTIKEDDLFIIANIGNDMEEKVERDLTLVPEKNATSKINEIDEKPQNWKYDGIVQYWDSRSMAMTSDKVMSNIFDYDLSESVESLSSVPPGTSFWSHRISDFSNKFNDVIPAKKKVSVNDENDSSSFRKGSEMSDALSVDTMSFPGNFTPPPLITRNKIIAILMDKKQFVHHWLEIFGNQLKEESLFVSSLFFFLVYYICYFVSYCAIDFKCTCD